VVLIEGLSKSPRHSSQTLQQQFGSTNEAIIAPIRLASSGNVVAYRERRLLGRPRPLDVLDFEAPRLARTPLPVRLPAAVFRVDLRVAAADLLPPAERFVFARLVVVLPRLAVAFFVVERLLCLRGFSVVPVTASAMALAALETPSIAASMLVLAVSAIVPKTPSFSLSMPFTSFLCVRAVYPRLTMSLGRGQSLTMTKLCRVRVIGRTNTPPKASSVPRPCRCCCAKPSSACPMGASAFDARQSFG